MSKAAFSLFTPLLLEIDAGITTNPVVLSCEDLVPPRLPLRGVDRRHGQVLLTWGCTSSCPLPSQVAIQYVPCCIHQTVNSCDLSLFGLGPPSLVPASAWAQRHHQRNPCELRMESQECMMSSLPLCSPVCLNV